MHINKILPFTLALTSFISPAAVNAEEIELKGLSVAMSYNSLVSKLEDMCPDEQFNKRQDPLDGWEIGYICSNPPIILGNMAYANGPAGNNEEELAFISYGCENFNSCSLTKNEWAQFVVDNLPVETLSPDGAGGYEGRSESGEWVTAGDGGLTIEPGNYGSAGPSLD